MSVFRNIGLDEPPIQGRNYYPGEVVSVGVARGLDDEVRIALRGGVDAEVLLTHDDVRRLISRLQEAIND